MPSPFSRYSAILVTVTPGDGPDETGRQRTRDQVRAITDAHPRLLVDSDDLADFNFICDRDHVLLPPEDPDPNVDAVNVLVGYLSDRVAGQSEVEPSDTDLTGIGELPDLQPRTGCRGATCSRPAGSPSQAAGTSW